MIEKLLDEPYWSEMPEEIVRFKSHAQSISNSNVSTLKPYLTQRDYADYFVDKYLHYRLGENDPQVYSNLYPKFDDRLIEPTQVKQMVLGLAWLYISKNMKAIGDVVLVSNQPSGNQKRRWKLEAETFLLENIQVLDVGLIVENFLAVIKNRSKSIQS